MPICAMSRALAPVSFPILMGLAKAAYDRDAKRMHESCSVPRMDVSKSRHACITCLGIRMTLKSIRKPSQRHEKKS